MVVASFPQRQADALAESAVPPVLGVVTPGGAGGSASAIRASETGKSAADADDKRTAAWVSCEAPSLTRACIGAVTQAPP